MGRASLGQLLALLLVDRRDLIRLAFACPAAPIAAGLSLEGSTVITWSRPGESWIVISVVKVGSTMPMSWPALGGFCAWGRADLHDGDHDP